MVGKGKNAERSLSNSQPGRMDVKKFRFRAGHLDLGLDAAKPEAHVHFSSQLATMNVLLREYRGYKTTVNAVLNMKGTLLYYMHEYEHAIDVFQGILSKDNTNLNAIKNLELLYKELGLQKKANEFEKMYTERERVMAEPNQTPNILKATFLGEQAFAIIFDCHAGVHKCKGFERARELFKECLNCSSFDHIDLYQWKYWYAQLIFKDTNTEKRESEEIIRDYLQPIIDSPDENLSVLRVFARTLLGQFQYKKLPSLIDKAAETFKEARSLHGKDPKELMVRYSLFLLGNIKQDPDVENLKKAKDLIDKCTELDSISCEKRGPADQNNSVESFILKPFQTKTDIHSESCWFPYSVKCKVYLHLFQAQCQCFGHDNPEQKQSQCPFVSLLDTLIEEGEKCAQMAPTVELFNNIGVAYHQKAKHESDEEKSSSLYRKALSHFLRALRHLDGTKHSYVHVSHGKCLLDVKEFRPAVECFKRAINSESKNEKVYYYLLDSYISLCVEMLSYCTPSAPGAGTTSTPEADIISSPGTDIISTPGASTTPTPGIGSTSAPGAATKSTPEAGIISTSGAGTISTPGAGTTSTSGIGTTSTPEAGIISTPGAGITSSPGAGITSSPGISTLSTPEEGTIPTPVAGIISIPGAGIKFTPRAGIASTPEADNTECLTGVLNEASHWLRTLSDKNSWKAGKCQGMKLKNMLNEYIEKIKDNKYKYEALARVVATLFTRCQNFNSDTFRDDLLKDQKRFAAKVFCFILRNPHIDRKHLSNIIMLYDDDLLKNSCPGLEQNIADALLVYRQTCCSQDCSFLLKKCDYRAIKIFQEMNERFPEFSRRLVEKVNSADRKFASVLSHHADEEGTMEMTIDIGPGDWASEVLAAIHQHIRKEKPILSKCLSHIEDHLLDIVDGHFELLQLRHATEKSPRCRQSQFEYDFFVLHNESEDDKNFVQNELVPTLEKRYGFKGCFPDRDLTPGQPMFAEMEEKMDKSYKILVILSKEFTKDAKCIFLLNMAFNSKGESVIHIETEAIEAKDVPSTLKLKVPLKAVKKFDIERLTRALENTLD